MRIVKPLEDHHVVLLLRRWAVGGTALALPKKGDNPVEQRFGLILESGPMSKQYEALEGKQRAHAGQVIVFDRMLPTQPDPSGPLMCVVPDNHVIGVVQQEGTYPVPEEGAWAIKFCEIKDVETVFGAAVAEGQKKAVEDAYHIAAAGVKAAEADEKLGRAMDRAVTVPP